MKCECKGHPFNCYDHPNDCGCTEPKPDSVEITDDQVAYAKELAEATRQRWKDHADSVGITVKGSCGIIHQTFKDWQNCDMCKTIDENNKNGNTLSSNENVYSKSIWNAAIEAAANVVKPIDLNLMPEECRTNIERLAHDVRQMAMENIRKLKK